MPSPPINQLAAAARAAYAGGRFGEARNACEALLAQDRKSLLAQELLGRMALKSGRLEEALRRFRACATAQPRELDYQYLVGLALNDLGRTAEAVAKYDKVLKAKPNMTLVIQSKAAALDRLGDVDAAAAMLRPIVEAGGETPAMVDLLARIALRQGRAAEAIDLLRRHLDDPGIADGDRQGLLFGLVKAYDKAGEYDAAFGAAVEANAVGARPFDRAAYRARIDAHIDVFSAPAIAARPRASRPSDRPVIIAGMPRSGTTLVEQIIDAHPRAHGAGELTFLDEVLADIQMRLDSFEPYPACLEDLTAETCDRLSAEYLNTLRAFSRTATRIVDKTLHNVEHLGFLSLLCPASHVIATRREPMDTGLSCFLNPILATRLPWITDLGDIGFVHGQQRRLMRHWRAVLEVPILEVEYQRLIDEQERMTREMIEFVGLPFHDRCLEFHASGRPVMTLSYDQVDRPVYRTSLDRWRNYEKHLGPLREALEAEEGD
jgi:tetratricopeptide (TPR) repeat protein